MNWNEIEARLPHPTSSLPAAPSLTGSDKQIEWAKKIRVEIVKDLRSSVIGTKAEILPATRSTESMMEYLKKAYDFWGHDEIGDEKVEAALTSMIEAADRWSRLVELTGETDSRYWIDNRTDGEKNYMNKALKSYVMGR